MQYHWSTEAVFKVWDSVEPAEAARPAASLIDFITDKPFVTEWSDDTEGATSKSSLAETLCGGSADLLSSFEVAETWVSASDGVELDSSTSSAFFGESLELSSSARQPLSATAAEIYNKHARLSTVT